MKKFLILVLVFVLPGVVFSQSKAASFIKMISSRTYHMKTKMVGGGMETDMEMWVKGDNAATVMESGGQRSRMIMRDNKLHMIDDTAKTIMVIPTSPDSREDPVSIDGKMTGSGTANFNGKNMSYEEYTDEDGTKAWWFFDGSRLAGMRNFTSEGNIDIIVLALDQNVPANVFNLPTGYKTQSFQF